MKLKSFIKLGAIGLLSSLLISNVNAETIESRTEKMKEQLNSYHFDIKNINLNDNVEMITADLDEWAKEWFGSLERIYAFKVRSELEKVIDLQPDNMMDVTCYIKGKEYDYYDSSSSQLIKKTADKDYCYLYIGFMDEEGNIPESNSFETEITGTFTEVEENETYKKEALKIVKELMGNSYVVDLDSINHYMNYKTSTSSFFDGNNALIEFAKLKTQVAENPNYEFTVSFEEIRRGDYFVGIEDGMVFISKDNIIYGYVNNEYGAGGLYFVPMGTKEEDYEKVLTDRIKQYLKNDKIEVSVEKKNIVNYDGRLFHVVNASSVVLNVLNMTPEEYYKKYNTSALLERAKLDDDTDTSEVVIAVPAYTLKLDGKEYEIGIIEVDDNTLNRVGLISSTDKETGIIYNTKAGNVPLDAVLNVKNIEVTKELKDYLNKIGYSNVESFDFKLYSKLLDKYISEFNDETDILIPTNLESAANLKMLYVSDNNEVEYLDVELVTINNEKYLKFSPKHFSNYILAEQLSTVEEKNPQTFDGIATWAITGIVSGLCLTGLIILRKKQNL